MEFTQPALVADERSLSADEEAFLESVFTRCVRTEQGCLLWLGYVDKDNGYSQIGYGAHQKFLGHRLIFGLAVRPLEPDEHVDHRCHNTDLFCGGNGTCLHRRCLEPAHLEAVSQAENNRRAAERARKTPGARWTNEMRGTCKNGLHPWIPENIKKTSRGGLLCGPCDHGRQDEYRQRKARREGRVIVPRPRRAA
jgi:hypothetical protein